MAKQPKPSSLPGLPGPPGPLDDIAGYVKKNLRMVKAAPMHHRHAEESVRQADHKGHHIVIRTTYEITVDGKPVTGHMGVDNDGQVHYHPVPNASFSSAVDLVKHLIDTSPEDFAARSTPAVTPRRDHVHEMPGMKGTKTRKRRR